MELKKRGDGNHTDHTIDKVSVEYKVPGNDKDAAIWKWYNNGDPLATGQKEEDDKEMVRQIPFDPPFVATEVKIHIKPKDTNMNRIEGRYDLIVAKEKEVDTEDDKKPVPAEKKEEADKNATAEADDGTSKEVKEDKEEIKEEEKALDEAKAKVASVKEQVKDDEDKE